MTQLFKCKYCDEVDHYKEITKHQKKCMNKLEEELKKYCIGCDIGIKGGDYSCYIIPVGKLDEHIDKNYIAIDKMMYTEEVRIQMNIVRKNTIEEMKETYIAKEKVEEMMKEAVHDYQRHGQI